MNYNNFNNYPYGNYYGMPSMYNPPMQPQYQQNYPQYQVQQPQAQQPSSNSMQQSSNYQPAYVNGIEGARAYILMPNQKMYLKDSDNENVFYIKASDNDGKCTLGAFTLTPIPLDSVGKKVEMQQPIKEDVFTRSDFNAFLGVFDKRMNDLSALVENLNQKPLKYPKNDYRNNKGD